jgi:hypothetical protein
MSKKINEIVEENRSKVKQLIEDNKKKMEAVIAETRVEGGKALFKEMENLFKDYPALGAIIWTQYTPYFNDGSECLFTVYNDYPLVIPAEEAEGIDFTTGENDLNRQLYEKHDKEVYCYEMPSCRSKNRKPEHDAIADFFERLDSDDYFHLFGDHARIVVTKDGLIIEEYEHE